MKSPSMPESVHPSTPESDFNPVEKGVRPNRAVDDSGEIGWFLKREEDELEGYVFDSELLRAGCD